jgi:hypothetical protein
MSPKLENRPLLKENLQIKSGNLQLMGKLKHTNEKMFAN